MNRGKQFEDAFKKSLEKYDICVDRLKDPSGKYLGIKNICDFIVYNKHFLYYIECKSRKGNVLNFKFDITNTQWNGLISKARHEGVICGILVLFSDHDFSVFVDIEELERLQNEGKKGLNIKDIHSNKIEYTILNGSKLRVNTTYDCKTFMDGLFETSKRKFKKVEIYGTRTGKD